MVSSPPANHTFYDYYDSDTEFQKNKKEECSYYWDAICASVIIIYKSVYIATFNYHVQFHFLEGVGG